MYAGGVREEGWGEAFPKGKHIAAAAAAAAAAASGGGEC